MSKKESNKDRPPHAPLSTSAGKKDTEKLFRYVGKENDRTEEAT